uniref:Uncharacterized protein n=1 Tax=Molossus molossus TaxID=27622 RepID=A0A7J8DC68_MOLMO|nr:hypothetical protein HJG59_009356 [Molossus molossus]
MKGGQQTWEEPKCRRCVLITGNGNMSALMSVCFYLEMKMHLCCPDPFVVSISEQKWDPRVHTHTHTHTHAHGLYLSAEVENQPRLSYRLQSLCGEGRGRDEEAPAFERWALLVPMGHRCEYVVHIHP